MKNSLNTQTRPTHRLAERHEAEATGMLCHSVVHHHAVLDVSVLVKVGSQVVVLHGLRKPAHENLADGTWGAVRRRPAEGKEHTSCKLVVKTGTTRCHMASQDGAGTTHTRTRRELRPY